MTTRQGNILLFNWAESCPCSHPVAKDEMGYLKGAGNENEWVQEKDEAKTEVFIFIF